MEGWQYLDATQTVQGFFAAGELLAWQEHFNRHAAVVRVRDL